MAFTYLRDKVHAADDELGLTIYRDVRFRGDGPPALWIKDTASDAEWYCPIVWDQARRTYMSAEGPRPYTAEVACRIWRRDLVAIAQEIAALKTAQGLVLSAEEAEQGLLQGATVYVTQGGAVLDNIPDFQVVLTDEATHNWHPSFLFPGRGEWRFD